MRAERERRGSGGRAVKEHFTAVSAFSGAKLRQFRAGCSVLYKNSENSQKLYKCIYIVQATAQVHIDWSLRENADLTGLIKRLKKLKVKMDAFWV